MAVAEALADVFGVANPQKLINESQAVLEVSDTTDLEEAAKFDFEAWAKSRGLTLPNGK